MRDQKKHDTENAKEGLLSLLCMDMQSVKLITQLKAHASYYKVKLQVHNFTIYNIITHKSKNYVWDETEGNLIASTFATIVVNHLKKEMLNTSNEQRFVIYSIKTEILYCIQMECDSSHL